MTNDDIVAKMKERMSELEKLYDKYLSELEILIRIRGDIYVVSIGSDCEAIMPLSIDKHLIMDYYEDLLKERFNDINKERCYLERLGIPSSRQKLQFNM